MVLYLRLLKESFNFAMNALRNNKLRTLLSLLGVTIGIFSIIAVLTAVDSLDNKIKADLDVLDKNTIYLTSVSFGPTDVPEWKRQQFPRVSYDEYQSLSGKLDGAEFTCFQIFVGSQTIKQEAKTAEGINMVAVSSEFADIQKLEFEDGRFYNEPESNSGAAVVVLGYEVAKTLFDDINPIGQNVRIYGQRFTVIGLLKKQGASMSVGGSNDTSAFIPANFIRRTFGDNNEAMLPVILIKPVKGADMDALKGEIKNKLRTIRGVHVQEIDNFFINVLSGFTDMIDTFIGFLNLGGWIIAGFSLLVGGFGIANIMFVSVKERTNLIGIQKSLGAKNRFILFQFLFEAVILSFIGGAIGLIMVFLISLGLSAALDFEFVLSLKNVLLGSGLSIFIGLISGIVPAISASKLDPVEAIRTGM